MILQSPGGLRLLDICLLALLNGSMISQTLNESSLLSEFSSYSESATPVYLFGHLVKAIIITEAATQLTAIKKQDKLNVDQRCSIL